MEKLSLQLRLHLLKHCLFVFFLTVLTITFHIEAIASSQPYLADHGVNFAIGNKYLVETDLSIQGPNAVLDFKRTYNSTNSQNGILGYGWSCSFTDQLEIDGGSITRVLSTGRHIAYEEDGNGGWVTQQGKKNTISSISGGYELTKSNGDVHTYDDQGRLTQIQLLNGYLRNFTYSDTQLTTIEDNFGKTLTFTYNIDGRLETLTAPTGTYTYSYLDDNLVSVTRPDSTTRNYHYTDANDAHNLTSVDDEAGFELMSVSYDEQDKVLTSSLAGHKAVTITYESTLSRIVTDEAGNQTSYQLEALNGVARVASSSGPGCTSCDGSGANSSYTYTARQQIESVINGRGYTTTYTYDDNGNRESETEAVGTTEERTITSSYNQTTNLLETITRDSVANPGQQVVTSMSYDTYGNLLTRTESGYNGVLPISQTTTFTYNSDSQLETIDGPRTDVVDVTTLSYYPNTEEEGLNRGYLHTVTNALGQVTTYSNYNALGKPESILDANQVLTTLAYDSNGRLLSSTTGSRIITYQYDDAGRINLVTMPGSRVLYYQYNSDGHMEKIIDSDSNYLAFQYDPVSGQVSRRTVHAADDTLTAEMSYEYDSYGRLYKEINPDADSSFTERGYDDAGNLISHTNELGNETSYGFDGLNRLISTLQPGTVTTSFSYDSHDNQTEITDGNSVTTTFTYDDFGQVISEISPDRGTSSCSYDEAGNLTTRTDGNLVTTFFEYDALNRLVSKSYPQAENDVTYQYDQGQYGIGKLTGMTDSTGSSVYSYNQYGERTSQSRTSDGITVDIGYEYNDNGELDSITYPSGRVVSYNRNNAGYVSSVEDNYETEDTTIVGSVTYSPFGPLSTMNLGNGLSVSREHDLQYHLTASSAGTIFNRNYSYLSNGLVETITDNIILANSQAFSYNELEMLTSASGSYGEVVYTLDGVGNRLTKSVDGTTEPYTYTNGSNRLDQLGDTNPVLFSYDDAGNITSKDDFSFTWDDENRLVSAVDLSGELGSYGFDGNNLRTTKNTSAGTEYFVYGIKGNLLAKLSSAGQVVEEYIYLGEERLALFHYPDTTADLQQVISALKIVSGLSSSVAQDVTGDSKIGLEDAIHPLTESAGDTSPQLYYYTNDHLGTSQILTDSNGLVVWHGDYQPFGEVNTVVNSIGNDFRFPGQYYDSETGLHYNHHRYYDPSTGRYISADPIGLDGGDVNIYSYAGQNPINATDPEGLFIVPMMVSPNTLPTPANKTECDLDKSCLRNCLSEYPGLDIALAMTPAALLNLKSPSQIAKKRPGASSWTSIDRKWPKLPGANPKGGATRPAGTIGRLKPVGTLGTAATAVSTFGTSYGATALMSCVSQCTKCECSNDDS